MPQFQAQYPQNNPNAPGYGFHTGFLTAMLVLGGFLGCLAFPKLADKISRKWALTVAVVFFDVGAIIQTAAKDYATLVVGRTIGGVGVGTLAMVRSICISNDEEK
jgi:MFS family permease